MELGQTQDAAIPPVPATVPGSVQKALVDSGWLPDPYHGLDSNACEWVENRHWVFETTVPGEWTDNAPQTHLEALGLDYAGEILVNGQRIGTFEGTFVPHRFDLTPHLQPGDNRLQIAFTDIPRWLGQFGYTSRMTQWKARFNYTWDWTSRLVQIGIWDKIRVVVTDGNRFKNLRAWTSGNQVHIQGSGPGRHTVRVRIGETECTFPATALADGIVVDAGPLARWRPNGSGEQALHPLKITLHDATGTEIDRDERTIGFRDIAWTANAGAPDGADPWICMVDGNPIFLQGVNWTPIRPLFADVTEEQIRARLETYRNLGINCLRVWGGATLETTAFYEHCDRLGLLVWQEFPLSSSGIDNWPPEDPESIAAHRAIAHDYVVRRQHHPSLFLWSGGNELQGSLDGSKTGTGKPCDLTHPLLAAQADVVATLDPTRRFVATSSTGPRFGAEEADFGKGLHWDVHGPWRADGDLDGAWTRYWTNDDALFRSETGHPGASPIDLLVGYAGNVEPFPVTHGNALWRRSPWWIEDQAFRNEHGRDPQSLEEYVDWSQQRQATALAIAASACRARFPRCGGFLVWMGHDCFPCTSNTAILDFHGRPKPAALALAAVFQQPLPKPETTTDS